MAAAVVSLALMVMVACGPVLATDASGDLARMAGDWVAESCVRTGNLPAPAEVLAKLSLKIEKDQWIQSFVKDTATYTLTLDPAQKTMTMRHNKTGVVLNTTYLFEGDDKLTITEIIDREPLDTNVRVWRRTTLKR